MKIPYRALAVSLFLLAGFIPRVVATPETEKTPYVQMTLLWTQDQSKMQGFFQNMAPLLQGQGLAQPRFFGTIAAVEGEAMEIPKLVMVIVFPDKAAYEAFTTTEAYAATRWENQGSDRQLVLAGPSLGGVGENVGSQRDLTVRQYFVDLVWFKKAKKYDKFLAAAQPVRESHGYKLERSFRPEILENGDLALPDIVNVCYHDTAQQYADYQADPTYPKLQKLYQKALTRSIRLVDTPGQ